MAVLESRIDSRGAGFAENRDRFIALVTELRIRLAAASRGGDDQARARHTRRGKLLARDRIARLLDPDTPLLEFSPLAAYGMYDGDAPAAGIV
ncbi:MAG: methylcrotonoyl-CoA carboxylase, partial [Thermomicrobiales bacterium]